MAQSTHKINCTSPINTIIVGRNPPRRFFVHRDVLCKSSEFFKAAPASSTQFELSSSNADAFDLYSSWLYTGNLPQTTSAGAPASWRLHARAYCLGEQVKDSKFKDIVIDNMVSGGRYYNLAETISSEHAFDVIVTIYNGTAPGSPARLFLTHAFEQAWSVTGLMRSGFKLPPAFVLDLMENLAQTLARVRKGENVPTLSPDACAYHSHAIDAETGRCPHNDAIADSNVNNNKRRRISISDDEDEDDA